MKLVVDSGSTKSDWGFFNTPYDLKVYKTQGMNPLHIHGDELKTIISHELLDKNPDIKPDQVKELFFYGSGCANNTICSQMENILKDYFPNASITVDSDMLGAARALCGNSEGVACVLGTGSNSCLYNGSTVKDQVPSLGYILGDEGSAAALGRRLINDCFKRQLPENVCKEFIEKYSLTKDIVIENVYRKPMANRYIANFATFLIDKRDIPEVHKLLVQCFSDFFTRNVISYHKPWMPVHFVGSLANSFSDELREAADSLGMTIGKIVTSPMEGLVEYHSPQN